MARAKKPRKVVFKREITYETLQQSNKSIMFVDPQLLADGEKFIETPPTKGYFETWTLTDKSNYFVRFDMTIDQLKQALEERTLTKASVVGKCVVDSHYIAVCNSRHKLLDKDDKSKVQIIDDWTGKIYCRIYQFEIDDMTQNYFVFEGTRSNRSCESFILISYDLFEDFDLS